MTLAVQDRRQIMLIIAGHLLVEAAARDDYVAACVTVVEAARAAPGCLDFSITADSLEPTRVIVYERWDGEDDLLAFRHSSVDVGEPPAFLDADVKRYGVSSISEP
jgi:quinol monooxygenase YgiN